MTKTKLRLSGGLMVVSLILRGLKEYGAVAYLFLALGMSVAGFVAFSAIDHNTQKIASQEKVVELAVRGSCQRVNVLRRNDNAGAVQRFEDDLLAARLLANRPSARRAFIGRAKLSKWTPLTDCDQAVASPHLFQAPARMLVWPYRHRLELIPR